MEKIKTDELLRALKERLKRAEKYMSETPFESQHEMTQGEVSCLEDIISALEKDDLSILNG